MSGHKFLEYKLQAAVRKHLQALIFITEGFLPGGIREGDIPETIPNSEVKTFIADGTARKGVGE